MGRVFYNWHRYYDPYTGKYITSDPLGLVDGPNTYQYACSNPVRYIDSLGLQSAVGAANPVNAGSFAAAGMGRRAAKSAAGATAATNNKDGDDCENCDKKYPGYKKCSAIPDYQYDSKRMELAGFTMKAPLEKALVLTLMAQENIGS